MRSKTILISCFIALILVVIYQLYQLGSLKVIREVKPTGGIPQFELEQLNGLPYSNIDLPANEKPIVFMFMDPTCHDCKEMVEKIITHYAEFKNVHFLMVTEADKSQVILFMKEFKISRDHDIQILLDKKEVMYRHFNLFSVPSFVIYDSNLKVVKVIDDKFNLSIVVKYVREAINKSSKKNF